MEKRIPIRRISIDALAEIVCLDHPCDHYRVPNPIVFHDGGQALFDNLGPGGLGEAARDHRLRGDHIVMPGARLLVSERVTHVARGLR